MANQGGTHDQHVKSGQQSHKSAGSSGSERNMSSSGSRDDQSKKHEQQMKPGQQGNKGKH
ncbi:hypothetical protein A6U87_25725 [Rhizobium sp. AC44/96]|jgi:hypothetical protein|uniref:hypothetical protein n=1 Tax=unclassified Rhizobium TaxID=2613769 RepID=UPI00080FBA52|nr:MULTISPECIES: hypothetical protein [unclassified Rhizobium]MDM9622324.1 hypothetical protein [Rhizobium sp. S96]OCJ14568.1 hypothetical protein A6U87_25725 [Rhizobium sp. AC44/96]